MHHGKSCIKNNQTWNRFLWLLWWSFAALNSTIFLVLIITTRNENTYMKCNQTVSFGVKKETSGIIASPARIVQHSVRYGDWNCCGHNDEPSHGYCSVIENSFQKIEQAECSGKRTMTLNSLHHSIFLGSYRHTGDWMDHSKKPIQGHKN